jgi:hypothetical protein
MTLFCYNGFKGAIMRITKILLFTLITLIASVGCDPVVLDPADTTKPVITLQGETTVTLTVGETYRDAGATASDDRDGNITDDITTVSDVNTSQAGTYHVTYTASDDAGNAADAVVRTVTVEEKTILTIASDGSGDYACDGEQDQIEINAALDRVASSDVLTTVYLQGPMTCTIEEPIVISSNTILRGDATVKVELKSFTEWPRNKPLIRQKGVKHWEGDLGEAIYGTMDDNISHIEISGFELTANTQDASNGSWYYILMIFYSASDIQVHDMHLHGSYGDMIRVMAPEPGINTNMKFYNNIMEDSGHEGLYIGYATDLEIFGNQIYGTRTNCGVRVGESSRISVYDNTIGNSLSDVPSGYAGVYIENNEQVLESAEIYGNYIFGKAGGIVLKSGTAADPKEMQKDVYIHHNRLFKIYDNTAGGDYFLNGGIHIYGAQNTRIENNTIEGSYQDGIIYEMGEHTDTGYQTIVRNNIISNSVRFGINNRAGDAHTFINEYNTLYNNAAGDYNQSSSGTDIHLDPLFVETAGTDPHAIDLHLRSEQGRWDSGTWVLDGVTSPGINSGDPTSSFAHEPTPNGGSINAGAYGNTMEASKSDRVDTTKKIFIIGDSTVRFDFDGDRDVNGSLHRTGWGSRLSAWMVHPENVFNRARRSAIAGGEEDYVHSYRRDAPIDAAVAANKGPYDWNSTKTLIEDANTSNGGFLLIQFGSNDKHHDVNETAFKAHVKFYIDQARLMGVTPILLTSINPKSTLTDTRAPFPDYLWEIGAAEDVPVLDLHTRSLAVYETYTLAQRYGLFGAWQLDGVTRDVTHLDRRGATIVAEWVKDLACAQSTTQRLCEQFDREASLLYAYAGEDQNVSPDTVVDLNGSGLDTDGTIVSYLWEEGGTTLSSDRLLSYSSNVEGSHLLTLTVTDNAGNRATDEVVIGIQSADAVDRIVLENAEDGNTNGWGLYGTEEGSSITNAYDDVRKSHVIVLHGDDGLENGFSFTNHNISAHPVVSWAMRYDEAFKFFVKVDTTNADHNPLYIYYAPDATRPTYEESGGKKYIHVGVGSFARTDHWIDFSRDVEADLQSVFGDENLSLIHGFYVRGSGRIDDISVADRGGEYPAQSAFFAQDAVATARVDFNASYAEAVFGTHVTRITDRSVQTDNAHPYPKQGSAWNSDGTLLRMGYRLYDAVTFQELAITAGLDRDQAYAKLGSPQNGSGDLRWSATEADTIFVLDSSQRFKKIILNAERTDVSQEILIDMSGLGYSAISTGNNEGNLDWLDSYVVFAAKNEGDDTVFGLLYHLGEASLTWQKEIHRGVWGGTNEHYFDWISVDPTAHHLVVNAEGKTWLYDMNLSGEVELDEYAGHGDMGVDVNGDPVYVQMIYGGTAIRSYNLRTHASLDLLGSNHGGGHISCRNVQRPGWCYVNTSEEGYTEVFALKLDDHVSGVVERYAQTHVSETRHELTQVNVSPDGTKVLFGSDWGDTDNALDTYQVDIKW